MQKTIKFAVRANRQGFPPNTFVTVATGRGKSPLSRHGSRNEANWKWRKDHATYLRRVLGNLGKRRAYNALGGEAPPGVAELGEEVWRSNRQPHERGLLVLGTPLGTPEFVTSHAETRVAEERRLHDLLLLSARAQERRLFAVRRLPQREW